MSSFAKNYGSKVFDINRFYNIEVDYKNQKILLEDIDEAYHIYGPDIIRYIYNDDINYDEIMELIKNNDIIESVIIGDGNSSEQHITLFRKIFKV